MRFPPIFQIPFFMQRAFTQRGRVLFVLVLAISVGVLIGISQGPSPQAAAFDVRSIDTGMLTPVEQRTSIVGSAIPLPTQLPADVAAVSAEAVTQAKAPAEVIPTESAARNVSGLVVARADAFASEPEQHVALRMASAFAGVDVLGAPPVPERWPGFASLAGSGGGTMVAGADAPLLADETEKEAVTTQPETEVAAVDPKPVVGGKKLTDRPVLERKDAARSPADEQPVPEPSSLVLMVVAMLGLGLMARRIRT